MQLDLFTGKLVRLTAVDSQRLAEALSHWGRDSEYWRLLASDPARLHTIKGTKEWLDKDLEKDPPKNLIFEIHTLDGDRLIGETGFDGIHWQHGDTFIGIGLGERDAWGNGYGTDAMRIMLRYAFTELNLHRVSLDVFEYNPRAIRSYEKAGFKHEGRMRQSMLREGRRWDLLFMGITQAEWLEIQNGD